MNMFKVDGKCPEGCARCCTCQLPLSEPEIKKLRQYIRRNNIQDSNLGEDACPFLDENKRCRVYIHRPSICKFFDCTGSEDYFYHQDKSIVDMRETFYPGTSTLTDTDRINKYYQIKKERAFKEKKHD